MITLSEYLSSLDFDYKVNKNNTISLIDLQDAIGVMKVKRNRN